LTARINNAGKDSNTTAKERFAQAELDRNQTAFLHEINAMGSGFSVVIVFGGPELYRQDRRQQYLFAMEALLDHPPDFAPLPRQGFVVHEIEPAYDATGETAALAGNIPATGTLRMVGRLFTLFILVEKGDRLYIIDQHAAHERLLYDHCLAGHIPVQELLVPIPFTSDSDTTDLFLAGHREGLEQLGVCIEEDNGAWRITALPVNWKLSDSDTVKAILELETAGENIAERWAATLSCHSAVKDGDWLDDGTAFALAEAALKLSYPRCSHDREHAFLRTMKITAY
jgi:DNA mismatch repair protein MutL